MYRWIIKKYYDDTDNYVATSQDGFDNYNQCLEDMLKHRNSDIAFRDVFEKQIKKVEMIVEELKEEGNKDE